MTDDGEALKSQRLHRLRLIIGHGALGVADVVCSSGRLGAVAIASEVRSYDREMLGQEGGNPMPHDVSLRIAVE
jgi:hypothetical protein